MSETIKKEKKSKKDKAPKEGGVSESSSAMAAQDAGLHIKSEAVTKPIEERATPFAGHVRSRWQA